MISRILRTRGSAISPFLLNSNKLATSILNAIRKDQHTSMPHIGADGIIHSEFPPVAVQDRPFHETLTEAIWRHSVEQPTRSAIINAENPSDQVTYSEIFLRIYSAANYLNSIGFTKGDIATVLLPNSWQYLVIFGSVTMQGGCITGLNPLSTDYELQHAFVETNCKVIFLPDIFLDRIWEVAQECPHIEKLVVVPSAYPPTEMPNNLPDKVVSFTHMITQFPSIHAQTAQIDAHKDLAFLPFSSGTTGPPKAVMLTHTNIGTMARIFNHHLDNQIVKKMDPNWDWRNEYQLVVLPFYHIYGFILGINILLSGATGILLRRFDLDLFCRAIQDYKIKFVCVVPPILVALAKSRAVRRYDLSSLRFIITGAAPVGRDLCDEVIKAIPSVEQIAQGYGMTEESMASHLPVFGMNNPAAAGRLASNFEMKIVDVGKGKPVPLYQRGEIWCRGPTIMKGYLNKPEMTADTIDKDGWLKTGDVGYHDDAGWTHVVDRLKELIKVKAFQVAPAELEDMLLSHSAIRDCAVIGIPDRTSGEVPKAFVVRRDELLTEHDVKEFVKSKVANYKQIRAVQFVDEIPKSPSGKILRRMLKEMYCS